MALRLGRRYVSDEAALSESLSQIKLRACPHCRRIGALIGHGFLRGYAERGSELEVRGRRFFCSNRYRRRGCGRTFSVLLATVVARFVVRAVTLFRFVELFVAGLTRNAAWRAASAGALSVSSGYRLWRRLERAQSVLRTRLCRECPPPACTHSERLAGLTAHFRTVFPSAACPFSESQVHFGRGLLD
jgi:hypothetical protein